MKRDKINGYFSLLRNKTRGGGKKRKLYIVVKCKLFKQFGIDVPEVAGVGLPGKLYFQFL